MKCSANNASGASRPHAGHVEKKEGGMDGLATGGAEKVLGEYFDSPGKVVDDFVLVVVMSIATGGLVGVVGGVVVGVVACGR